MGAILLNVSVFLFFLFLICLIPLLLKRIVSHEEDSRISKLTLILFLILIVLILITFAPLMLKVTRANWGLP